MNQVVESIFTITIWNLPIKTKVIILFISAKDHGFQQPYNAESIRSNQSNTFINMGKKEVPIEIYQLGGNNKFSDPTKKPVNLNNINMQTALRSIKSEDGRDDILPFYQHNHMEQKRNNKRE